MTRVTYTSTSRAMDGGLTAVTDISDLMNSRNIDDYRLIGGIAVLLHTERAGLDLPQRATRDADIGITTLALGKPDFVNAIEALGYSRIGGNRWERIVDGTEATVDLLILAYTSRPRDNVQVGDVITTEVRGLAEALLEPPETIDATFALTDGRELRAAVNLPDAAGMLALKCGARSARTESRDAIDLWRCLEVAHADNVQPQMFDRPPWTAVKTQLIKELIDPGRSIGDIGAGLNLDEAAKRATRIRGLMLSVTGVSS